MFETFKALGAPAFLVLILAVAGFSTAVLALVMSKHKRGLVAAIAAFMLTAVGCTSAAILTMRSRIDTDRAAEKVDSREREAFSDAGYSRAAGYSKVAAPFGILAFLVAAVAAVRGAAAEKRESEVAEKQPETVRMAHALPKASDLDRSGDSMASLGALVAGGLALFSLSVVLVPLLLKSGGSRLDPRDPANRLREAERLFADGKFEEGCAALEDGFEKQADPTHAKVKNLDSLISECVELKLARAAEVPDEERAKLLSSLEKSKMPLTDEQRERVKAAKSSR
ncbi:MAG: hypothetical protein U0271_18830 [Polyangiaceae bacterium]